MIEMINLNTGLLVMLIALAALIIKEVRKMSDAIQEIATDELVDKLADLVFAAQADAAAATARAKDAEAAASLAEAEAARARGDEEAAEAAAAAADAAREAAEAAKAEADEARAKADGDLADLLSKVSLSDATKAKLSTLLNTAIETDPVPVPEDPEVPVEEPVIEEPVVEDPAPVVPEEEKVVE